MSAERTVQLAQTVVLNAEAKYLDTLLDKYDQAEGRPMLQENIQNKVVAELERVKGGSFDEEEAILAKLAGFFKKRRKK